MKTQIGIPEILDSQQKSVSRRDFLKFGVSSFLGLIAMQHLQSSAWTPLRGSCRSRQTLHRPVHERRRESIGYV